MGTSGSNGIVLIIILMRSLTGYTKGKQRRLALLTYNGTAYFAAVPIIETDDTGYAEYSAGGTSYWRRGLGSELFSFAENHGRDSL